MTENGLRVLVVDDEPAIQRFLHMALSAEGYSVFAAVSGAEALSGVVAHRPDLIILDLGLPDMDGSEVTRRVREWASVPIIILSVRGQEADKIEALDAGADDYLTKPFGAGELLARMRVALRRASPSDSAPVFVSGDLTVDLARRMVTRRREGGAAHAHRVRPAPGARHSCREGADPPPDPAAGLGRRLRTGSAPAARERQQPETEDRTRRFASHVHRHRAGGRVSAQGPSR